MVTKILKLGNVQKLTIQQQKETTGGGGGINFGNLGTINTVEDTVEKTPGWKWRCYSSGTASYNKPQFFRSYTNLGYPYICNPI